jgi:hypothetical protein
VRSWNNANTQASVSLTGAESEKHAIWRQRWQLEHAPGRRRDRKLSRFFLRAVHRIERGYAGYFHRIFK